MSEVISTPVEAPESPSSEESPGGVEETESGYFGIVENVLDGGKSPEAAPEAPGQQVPDVPAIPDPGAAGPPRR